MKPDSIKRFVMDATGARDVELDMEADNAVTKFHATFDQGWLKFQYSTQLLAQEGEDVREFIKADIAQMWKSVKGGL